MTSEKMVIIIHTDLCEHLGTIFCVILTIIIGFKNMTPLCPQCPQSKSMLSVHKRHTCTLVDLPDPGFEHKMLLRIPAS